MTVEPAAVASRAKRIVAVVATTLAVPLIPFLVIGELPGERWLSAADDAASTFAALGAGLLALDVLLPVPSSVVGVMLGGRLGFGFGFACIWLGLSLGHCVGYWLGRLAPRRWASDLPPAPTLLGVFVTRAVPVLSEALCIAAGAVRVRFAPFAFVTVSGNALYALALAASGAALLPEGLALPALAVPLVLSAGALWLWRGKLGGRSSA